MDGTASPLRARLALLLVMTLSLSPWSPPVPTDRAPWPWPWHSSSPSTFSNEPRLRFRAPVPSSSSSSSDCLRMQSSPSSSYSSSSSSSSSSRAGPPPTFFAHALHNDNVTTLNNFVTRDPLTGKPVGDNSSVPTRSVVGFVQDCVGIAPHQRGTLCGARGSYLAGHYLWVAATEADAVTVGPTMPVTSTVSHKSTKCIKPKHNQSTRVMPPPPPLPGAVRTA